MSSYASRFTKRQLFRWLTALFSMWTTLAVLGFVWQRSQLEQSLQQSIQVVQSVRGYQGLVWDLSGTAAMIIGLTEKQGHIEVHQLRIGTGLSREFSESKYFVGMVVNQVRAFGEIESQPWEAELRFSIRKVIEILLISFLLSNTILMFKSIVILRKRKREELTRYRVQCEVAAQVAHDIRSPLAALSVVEGDISGLPEETRLMIRSAVSRIRDIANDLLDKNRALAQQSRDFSHHAHAQKNSEIIEVCLLPALLDDLITEKRLQYRFKVGVEIMHSLVSRAHDLFVAIQPDEFKRVISNLVNNAVEALPETGCVTLEISEESERIAIRVRDTGTGISSDILPRLARYGETYGKDGGSGLGLHHAKVCCESWGGTLEIDSTLGKGTCVTLFLPKATAPQWFVKEICLPARCVVVVLDDDQSIHQVWKSRFGKLRYFERESLELLHFTTPAQLRTWVALNSKNCQAQFLIDYELKGFPGSGLDLIEELKIAASAILVTSRHEEMGIRERCSQLGVAIIPKSMAALVPIRVLSINGTALPTGDSGKCCAFPEAVLIDDDSLVRLSWRLTAKRANVHLEIFSSPNEAEDRLNQLPLDTQIYIDSALGGGVEGQDIARNLYERGFTQLYMTTGYEATRFADMPWIKAVLGKEAPWSTVS